MEITLDHMRVGQRVRITHVDVDTALKCRLRSFGMVPGTQVCCRYRSPGGKVTALEIRGSVVALRTRDMKLIRGCC